MPTMPTMPLLAHVISGLISNFRINNYPSPRQRHQNCGVEGSIQTSTKWSGTMLLYDILHWPQVIDHTNVLQFWHFAMDHSIHMWNNLPVKKTHHSPIYIFTSTVHPNYDHLQRSHVWGSPMYVLQPELQDAKKIGKWLL
jgi:hypothetical protein